MKKLLIYLREYRKESIIAPLFKLLEVVFDLTVPLIVADMIDSGIVNGDAGVLYSRFILLIGMAVCGSPPKPRSALRPMCARRSLIMSRTYPGALLTPSAPIP